MGEAAALVERGGGFNGAAGTAGGAGDRNGNERAAAPDERDRRHSRNHGAVVANGGRGLGRSPDGLYAAELLEGLVAVDRPTVATPLNT